MSGEKQHALLSASGAHRWLNCTPSARLEREFEDSSGEAAAEGTAAHALCEHKLKRALKLRSKKPVSQYDSDEMDSHTDGYVEFVLELIEQAKQACADPKVLIEQRLDFSRFVPGGFGTGDCLVIADGTLHIVDFKYGQGILVEAEENPQMKLYALGALELFDGIYDITSVSLTIYHPAIIDKEMWEAAQLEMERRRNYALEYGIQKLEYATTDNPFAGRVICGSCGQVFGRKVWNSTDDRFRRIIWRCNGKYAPGIDACPGSAVKTKAQVGRRHEATGGNLFPGAVAADRRKRHE